MTYLEPNNQPYNFKLNLGKGHKAEAWALGFLQGVYLKDNKQIKNVQSYHPNGYRHDGLKLPDFAIVEDDTIISFCEVKAKAGVNDMLNISATDVHHYLKVAKREGCPVEVIFLCTKDLSVYKLNEKVLRKPTDSMKDRTVLLYDKEKCELLFGDMPSDIFQE